VASAVRRQVPLPLGWGLSIHKAQGLTLDGVALSLCSVFTFAMVYVAFSRVRHLEDIFSLSFDASLVSACPEAVAFHDSMRQLIF